jgi:hypothetical protein
VIFNQCSLSLQKGISKVTEKSGMKRWFSRDDRTLDNFL